MKNLANCDPVEFVSQGYRVIDAAKELLTVSKVFEIRNRKPVFNEEDTPEERREKAVVQAKKNISKMLAALMRDNPQKTAEVLGLMCFIEPSDLKNHKGMEFLGAATEMLKSREVIDFLFLLISEI